MDTLKAIYLLKWPRRETFSDHSAHVMTLDKTDNNSAGNEIDEN